MQPDADAVLADYLGSFLGLLRAFAEHGADAAASGIADRVSALCGTLGSEVRVELPGERELIGVAERLDRDGRLVVLDRRTVSRRLSPPATSRTCGINGRMTSAPTPGPAAPPAHPAERVVARLRRHARVLILPALLLMPRRGGGHLRRRRAGRGSGSSSPRSARSVFVVLLGCLLPFLAWLTRRTTITTRRIIMRSGIFVRVREELLHNRGNDVAVRRTWGQGMFGSGDVRINTGHEHPFVIRDVPKPDFQLQAALHELMEEAHTLVADRRRAEQSIVDGDTVAWGGR